MSKAASFAQRTEGERRPAGSIVLDVFSELQRARRGDPIRERQVYFDAIEQARLADQLGYGCWWTVEHHGATEFSYSSVPELVLTVLARETERIHLGHSGVLAPFRINHPIRVAERAAFTDVISNGRMELGLARSGGTEWDAFGVDPDRSRAMSLMMNADFGEAMIHRPLFLGRCLLHLLLDLVE